MTAATQTAVYHQPSFSLTEENTGHVETTLRTQFPYKPRDIQATVNYLKENEDGSPPDPVYIGHGPQKEPPKEENSRVVKIHDIRGTEDEYTLDKDGFQILKHSSAEKEFLDDEQVRRVYYEEVEELLKKVYVTSPHLRKVN
jgi:hypothetical protein